MPLPVMIGVLIALATALLGYVTNQLPSISQFQGRNALVCRLFGELVLILIVLALLIDETVAASTQTALRYGLVAIVTLLGVDALTLLTQLRRATKGIEGTPLDLRTGLLKGVQTEIAGRLEDSLQQQQYGTGAATSRSSTAILRLRSSLLVSNQPATTEHQL